MLKYWKLIFNKKNKKFLIISIILSEIVTILFFLTTSLIITIVLSRFKTIKVFDYDHKMLYFIFLGIYHFLFLPFIFHGVLKIKYIKKFKSEDLVRKDSSLDKDKYSDFILDDRKIIERNKRTLWPLVVSNQKKSDIEIFESNYPRADRTDKIGLLVRNIYNSKACKMEQYIVSEEHCAIAGTTGAGKSVLLVMPTILYFIEQIKLGKKISSFIFDPKGDLYSMTYEKMKKAGIKNYILDLDNPANSCGYNYLSIIWDEYHEAFEYLSKPLFYKRITNDSTLQSYTHTSSICFLHNMKPCQECYNLLKLNLIENGHVDIIFNTTKTNESFDKLKYFVNEEDWQNFKEFKYSKLIGDAQLDLEQLYLEFVPDKSSNGDTYFTASPRKWLVTFSLLLLELNIASGGLVVSKEEFNLATIAWILKNPKEATEWLEKYKELDGAINSKAVEAIQILNNIPADNQGSFLVEISNRLSVFSNEKTRKITSIHDVDIKNMFKEPTLFFVKLDPNKILSEGVLVTILCNQIYNEQSKYINEKIEYNRKDDKLDVTWINLIDEFSNLPPIQELESKLSFCRSRKIFWYMFIQDKVQVKARYSADIEKIVLSQARTFLYLLGDIESREYVSKNAGKRKVMKHSVDVVKGKSNSMTDSVEDLLTVDEIAKLPMPVAVVLNQSKQPAVTYLTPVFHYYDFKNNKGEPLLTQDIVPIPTTKTFSFNWQEQGRFNLFEYDPHKFDLSLINPEFYKMTENEMLSDKVIIEMIPKIDPLEVFLLNSDEELNLEKVEVLDTLKELVNKLVDAPVEEKEALLVEMIPKIEDMQSIIENLKHFENIKKQRKLNTSEKKAYIDFQKLLFDNKKNANR